MTDEEQANEMTDVPVSSKEPTTTTIASADNNNNNGNSTKIIDLADESTLSYCGVLVSAIIVLVALTSKGNFKDNKFYEYGIALSVVAMFISLAGWAMGRFDVGNDKITMVNNYFLFAWCFIGACIMTFGDGPFQTTGNGTSQLITVHNHFLVFHFLLFINLENVATLLPFHFFVDMAINRIHP